VAVLLCRYDSELKFIVLSTHEECEIAEKCISSGAWGYVFKRSAGEDLAQAVDEVLKGGIFVSPEWSPQYSVPRLRHPVQTT